MKPCKICGTKTNSVYNILFTATPICDSCGRSIFLQQAQWYAEQDLNRIGKIKSKENGIKTSIN